MHVVFKRWQLLLMFLVILLKSVVGGNGAFDGRKWLKYWQWSDVAAVNEGGLSSTAQFLVCVYDPMEVRRLYVPVSCLSWLWLFLKRRAISLQTLSSWVHLSMFTRKFEQHSTHFRVSFPHERDLCCTQEDHGGIPLIPLHHLSF